MKRIGVGLLGLGTVGTGVFKALKNNQDVILKRTELLFEIKGILVRNPSKKRNLEGVQSYITTDYQDVLESDVQVMIEVIGGLEPARTYIEQAFEAGCHVVTANKELIAKHGLELAKKAQKNGVQLLYEASVGGGIPILGTMQHFLKGSRLHRITGILNGTTNYILTRMTEEKASFGEVLADAQHQGYAEADPTSDVEGLDAAYKLSILSRLAFETHVPVDQISRTGIQDITPDELAICHQLGYAVKLLAKGEQFGEKGPVSLQVGPALLPLSHPLAKVNGVYNAIHLEGDLVQDVTLMGQGAGEQPTASAVIEDLCNVFRLPYLKNTCSDSTSGLSVTDEGGSRFVYVKTKKPVSRNLKEIQQSLSRNGYTVERLSTDPETGRNLGLIVRHWDSAYECSLPEDLDGDMVVNRPVSGGQFADDMDVHEPQVILETL
ncbi:homoserine dehydrogenase [Kroppenstedtia pulmonis]|uniref:Homoserine dehydrogenase n=1 Tax=Kroppenstedtia pulmonis TaxID=1380685 RepID=A0A7D4BR62_9BACL|nr:homoserine dehydrogenase [Kroppenstedtia pulmonis]QKG85311.1 homoserine dehydrogenase [Kroppenstedtia pulmonis]